PGTQDCAGSQYPACARTGAGTASPPLPNPAREETSPVTGGHRADENRSRFFASAPARKKAPSNCSCCEKRATHSMPQTASVNRRQSLANTDLSNTRTRSCCLLTPALENSDLSCDLTVSSLTPWTSAISRRPRPLT